MAWGSHVKVQLPGPVQRFVQVLPAWQMKVQPPPLHDVSHVAPDSHVMVQPPPLHDGMHVVPFLQSNVQPPLKHPGVQVPLVHVQEPSVPHPVLASAAASPASALASAFPSALASTAPVSLGWLESTGPESAEGWASPPPSPGTAASSHAQTATNPNATARCMHRRAIIEMPCSRTAPSTG